MVRMEPTSPGSSVEPGAHHLWTMEGAVAEAEDSAMRRSFAAGRSGSLFLNRAVADALGEQDADQLLTILQDNVEAAPESRSRWFRLRRPITRYARRDVRPIVELQVKGVVFDARQPIRVYDGMGWRPEYYFADRDAVFQRYHPGHDALGSCYLSEAVKEYAYTLSAYPALTGQGVEVPMPIGWGAFDGRVYEGAPLGFVVLGLPEHGPRGAAYVEGLAALRSRGDRQPVVPPLRRRAAALRKVHAAGFLMPFRHFHNLSETPDGVVIMHDLGDRCALRRRDLHGPDQLAAQAFTDLAFAMAPLEHVVEKAPMYLESRGAILEDLDWFAAPSIEGYFGAPAAELGFSFAAVEEAFRLGFERPFHALDHPVARAFRALFPAPARS